VIEADLDDDMVLACAVVGQASHLVTYDLHFAPLGDVYRGVRLIDGLHFLYLVRGDQPPN
jgi:predicted nucleic acid-binding protein